MRGFYWLIGVAMGYFLATEQLKYVVPLGIFIFILSMLSNAEDNYDD